MLRRAGQVVGVAGSAWIGGIAYYNIRYPLNIVWDLDETLVSSKEIPVASPKPGKERVLHVDREKIEHIDDDGLHFVTFLRPYALKVLRLFHILPGCRQFVSTSASPGYMNNVLVLLDPQNKIVHTASAGQSSRGKVMSDVLPIGCDPELKRTVLVDNRASCHKPQPFNGVVVTDYVHPAHEMVVQDSLTAREIARFPAAVSGRVPSHVITGCQRIELEVAARGEGKLVDVAQHGADADAIALVLANKARDVSCFPFDDDKLALPVISVGAAGARVLQEHKNTFIRVQPSSDREMLRVCGVLMACWLVPKVQWVLRKDASESTL